MLPLTLYFLSRPSLPGEDESGLQSRNGNGRMAKTKAVEMPAGNEPYRARFESIIGHDEVLRYLRQAMASGKLPQTIIFDGPSGIGKTAMAFALAKCLFAGGVESGAEFDRQARKLECDPPIHPDVRIFQPSGASNTIQIKEIREALDIASQMPIEGARRVFIIDPADRLNVSAANSLLKLLEEPPTLLTTILTTETLHSLLPTIRSRGSRLRLHALADETIAQWLMDKHHADPKLARIAALFSNGAPGCALQQLNGKSVTDRDTLISEWQFFQKNKFQSLFRVACNLAEIEQSIEALLGVWIAWLRDALVTASAPGQAELLVNRDRAADLAAEAERLGPRVIGRCIDHLIESRADARRLIPRQLFFENLLLRLGPELKQAGS